MKTQAVRTINGWYLRDVPGFEDIHSNTVEVDVKLSAGESTRRDYKELRGIAIMERYLEKEERSEPVRQGSESRDAFRKIYGYEGISGMEDVLRILKGSQP